MEHLGLEPRGAYYDFLEGWAPKNGSWKAIYFVIDERSALAVWGANGMSPECQRLAAWLRGPELSYANEENLFIKAY